TAHPHCVCSFVSLHYPHDNLASLPTRRSSDLNTASAIDWPPSSLRSSFWRIVTARFRMRAALDPLMPSMGPSFATGTSGRPKAKIGRATSELQSPDHLVCRLLLEVTNIIFRYT